MPLYDYACEKCGHQFEARQKISEDPLKTCPKCGTDALQRLVSKTSFALKGSGWYADGYGSKASDDKPSKETKSESPKSDTAPAAPKAEAKTETKSEPAKDTKTPAKSGD